MVEAEIRRWLVKGRVQGVGFRWFVRDEATALGLAGWVRNRADGAVELLAGGPPEALEALEERLAAGPPASRVDAVERLTVAAGEAAGPRFEIGRSHQARGMRDRPEPVRQIIGAGQHGQNAGGGMHRPRIDRDKPRMRVGRTHDHRMRQVRWRQIVYVTAPSGEQAPILLAKH